MQPELTGRRPSRPKGPTHPFAFATLSYRFQEIRPCTNALRENPCVVLNRSNPALKPHRLLCQPSALPPQRYCLNFIKKGLTPNTNNQKAIVPPPPSATAPLRKPCHQADQEEAAASFRVLVTAIQSTAAIKFRNNRHLASTPSCGLKNLSLIPYPYSRLLRFW